MSAPFLPQPLLSREEWKELCHLKEAISHHPSTVTIEKQERFTALFTRSLMGKGDSRLQ